MTEYLQLLLLNLLLIFGVWKLFQVGEIFGAMGDWITKRTGDFWVKPLFDCPSCMSSAWGALFFFASGMYLWLPWYALPFHCVALCGAATIVMLIAHE